MKYPEIIKDFIRYKHLINSLDSDISFHRKMGVYQYFFKWRFYKNKKDTLKYKLPWITFPAVYFLKKYLKKNMIVFEYGCGGSTLFFARRTKMVYCIEHDKNWYYKMKEVLKNEKIKNVNIQLIEPQVGYENLNIYKSSTPGYLNHSFKFYVSAIDKFPNNYFDLVFIDGRARNGCFEHSRIKIKETGFIMWDNSERIRYRSFFSSYDYKDLCGPTVFSKENTCTTLFNYQER